LLKRFWVLGLSGAAIIVVAVFSYWLVPPVMPPRVLGYTRLTNDGRSKSFRIDAFPIIVTDGLRLYFAEAANSGMRSTLNEASASGGETFSVLTPLGQNVEVGDIAANRSKLLLQTFTALGIGNADRVVSFSFSDNIPSCPFYQLKLAASPSGASSWPLPES